MAEHQQGLEPHQYEDIFQEDDIPLRDISHRSNRFLYYFGIILLVILVLISFLVKIPREVNLVFELRGGSKEKMLQFPQPVYIIEKFIQIGDSIKKGQALVAISSPFIVGFIDQIEKANSELAFYQKNITQNNTEEIKSLEVKINNTQLELSKSQAEYQITRNAQNRELKVLKAQLHTAESLWKRNQKLHTEQVISDQQLEESFQSYKGSEQNLTQIQETYNLSLGRLQTQSTNLQNLIRQLNQELSLLKSGHQVNQKSILLKKEQAEKSLKLYFGEYQIKENTIILKSPQDGVITLMASQEGELPVGEMLLRLQTAQESFDAIAQANSVQIGSLKKGQKAVLKYDSFPYYYYGTMQGKTSSISSSPNAQGNFIVNIQITEQKRLKDKVKKGMRGTVSIVSEEMPLIFYMLRKSLSTKD